MKYKNIAQFQIGKFGLTSGVLESLKNILKNYKQVRISVLKAAGRDRNQMKEFVKKLDSQLGISCDYTLLGFTIILRRRLSKIKK